MKPLLANYLKYLLEDINSPNKKDDATIFDPNKNLVRFATTKLNGKPIYTYGPRSVPPERRSVRTSTHWAPFNNSKNRQLITKDQRSQLARKVNRFKGADTKQEPSEPETTAPDKPSDVGIDIPDEYKQLGWDIEVPKGWEEDVGDKPSKITRKAVEKRVKSIADRLKKRTAQGIKKELDTIKKERSFLVKKDLTANDTIISEEHIESINSSFDKLVKSAESHIQDVNSDTNIPEDVRRFLTVATTTDMLSEAKQLKEYLTFMTVGKEINKSPEDYGLSTESASLETSYFFNKYYDSIKNLNMSRETANYELLKRHLATNDHDESYRANITLGRLQFPNKDRKKIDDLSDYIPEDETRQRTEEAIKTFQSIFPEDMLSSFKDTPLNISTKISHDLGSYHVHDSRSNTAEILLGSGTGIRNPNKLPYKTLFHELCHHIELKEGELKKSVSFIEQMQKPVPPEMEGTIVDDNKYKDSILRVLYAKREEGSYFKGDYEGKRLKPTIKADVPWPYTGDKLAGYAHRLYGELGKLSNGVEITPIKPKQVPFKHAIDNRTYWVYGAEILTTGVESLITNPTRFYREKREHFYHTMERLGKTP